MDGFTQRLLLRTDSLRSRGNSGVKKLRLQLILNAITKDALPLVAVNLPNCNMSPSEKEGLEPPNCHVTGTGGNSERGAEWERLPTSAIIGLPVTDGFGSRQSKLVENEQVADSEEKTNIALTDSNSFVSMHSYSPVPNDSETVTSATDTCTDGDDSPCSKGAVARAWAAVMCVGGQLKMGEQILLAHEVCEVDCHKEEVGKLNCCKMAANANQLLRADEFQDLKTTETSTDVKIREKNDGDCLTDGSVINYFDNHNSLETDGSAESVTGSEKANQECIIKLLRKACAQKAVIVQVSKALELCKLSPSSTTEERVESERLLLLANQTLKALLREVDRLKDCGPECSTSISKGMLFMRDITLPLTTEFVNAAKKEAVNFWFVCLAIHREYVVSTSATHEIGNGGLYFAGPVFVPDLDENFKLFLNVYSLRLKQAKLERKKYKVKKCKMLPSSSKLKLSKVKIFLPPSTTTHSSSFTLVGSLELDVSVMKQHAWPLTKVTASSPLSGSVHIKVDPHLCSVEVRRSGFLSVLEEVAGGPRLWHHRWCDLDQCSLSFWNYPSEKILGKPALRCVDLRKCTSPVGPAPRELCSRPHAFLVYVGSREFMSEVTSSIVGKERHIFSADSKKEMEEWCNLLNSVVAAIKLWSGPEA